MELFTSVLLLTLVIQNVALGAGMNIIGRGSIVDWQDIQLEQGALLTLGSGEYNLTNFNGGPGAQIILVCPSPFDSILYLQKISLV